ncbi:hypothetical protein PQX77_008194 [Marasmius sp. AFHP31]|nr:hypothetical protein PQX77_008194 [Marasmius sp. AFHP31]
MSSTSPTGRLDSSTVPSKNDNPGAPTGPSNESSTPTSGSSTPSSSSNSTSASASPSSGNTPPSSTSQTNTSTGGDGSPNTAQTSPTDVALQRTGASTTTSVVMVKGTAPSTTVVSTITDAPKSTLKSPINGVLVTESDGHTSLSFPAFVTVLSTSQEADGSFVTYTHTMANPTGADVFGAGSKPGFFQNHGAVAGVFLALGIVLASMAGCIFWMIRRRRKRQSSTHRWIEDMRRHPAPTPPFVDDPFHDEPPMTAVDPRHRVALRSPDHFQLDDGPLIPLTPTYQSGAPVTMSNVQRKRPPTSEGPFSDENAVGPGPVGVAITSDRSHGYDRPLRPPSPLQFSRQSTPSLYPPTDRDELEEIDLDDDDSPTPPQHFRQPVNDSSVDATRPGSGDVQHAPPRPPRSVLRAPSKVYEPYTPPPSDSNHSGTESPITPISEKPFERLQRSTAPRPLSKGEVDDIFSRPTLLNVRPRSKDGENTK